MEDWRGCRFARCSWWGGSWRYGTSALETAARSVGGRSLCHDISHDPETTPGLHSFRDFVECPQKFPQATWLPARTGP